MLFNDLKFTNKALCWLLLLVSYSVWYRPPLSSCT